MEGGKIFQNKIHDLHLSRIHCFDIMTTLVAGVDPIDFIVLRKEVIERIRILVLTEGADEAIDPPFITTKRAEQITPSPYSFDETQEGNRTWDNVL